MTKKETIVESKTCKLCSAFFDVTDSDLEFYERVSPIFNWERYTIPSPSTCPDCSLQKRLAWRNERNLYRRKCDATWKNIVSMFSPDKPYKVYEQGEWWSDKWDPKDYSKEFDFSKTFFEQWGELLLNIPQVSLAVQDSENSEYSNYAINNKNCYLTFWGDYSEDCEYGTFQFYTKNSVDFYRIINCENTYECINCNECYDTSFSRDSKNLSSCSFCINCTSCTDCIWCNNLTNKQYYIFNKQSTKEEVEKIKSSFSKYSNLKEFKNKVYDFFSKWIYKYADISQSENCTWDRISSSKDCDNCFWVDSWENWKDLFICINFNNVRNSALIWFWSDNVYDSFWITSWFNMAFTSYTWGDNTNIYYCNQCYNNCNNLFGCIWLRSSSYCILNKQYSKEEYETLVPKIINHMKSNWEWWEFPAASLSQFWYNESVACEYFPLTKEEAIEKWFKWSDFENPAPNVEKIIPASKLPDSIDDIPDDILNWAINCEISNKPFRIIKPELEFYRKHSLPIPRRHPDLRHLDRMKLRNPMKIYDRNCDKCGADIKTTYSPNRTEIIYCEECYNKNII